MKSGRLTALINKEQLEELEPRSSQWVSDLLNISSHRHKGLVPRCNSSTNAVAGKSLLEMTLSTTGSATYSRHYELSDDNQRIAHLLGADLNESSMSWTSSLATPIISSFVVTPLHNSTLGSLKKDPKDGSCFLLPSLTPRAPLSHKQERRTAQGSSSRRVQVCPRTLFSASASSLLENPSTNLLLDVGGNTMISSATASTDGDNLVPDGKLVAVSVEGEPSELLKNEPRRIFDSGNLNEQQPVAMSEVNESSVFGNPSDDALSLFFQSPEVGAQRKLRRVPKQRAKRKYIPDVTPGLDSSPNISHSLVSDSEHWARNDEKPLAQSEEDFSLRNQSSSFFQIDNSFKRPKLGMDADAVSETSAIRLPSDTDVALSDQRISDKSSIMPRASSIADVTIDNAEDAILSINAHVSTASSISSKMGFETMNTVLEPNSRAHDFEPEVTTKIVSTVRPIFFRNNSKLQSPVNFPSRCVNQSFSDLAPSPFSVLPECTSTPIRLLTNVKEHQDKNLSSADVDILHHGRDSGTGQMNRASGSFLPNAGVGYSGLTVYSAQGASSLSSSKCNSEAGSQGLLQALKKPKKFVYPTAAQIAKTCPKRVFSFQSKPATANLILENKKPDVSFHSPKRCILPAAAFPVAKESISQHITSDAHLNLISEAEQKSSRVVSVLGNTCTDDDALLQPGSESGKTSVACPLNSLPSKAYLSNPMCAIAVQQNSGTTKSCTAGTNPVPLAVSSSKNSSTVTNPGYGEHGNRNEASAFSRHATALTDICATSPEAVGSQSRLSPYFQEPVGFRMASWKQVTISEGAIARVEKLLSDVISDTGLSAFNVRPSQKTGGSFLDGASVVSMVERFEEDGDSSRAELCHMRNSVEPCMVATDALSNSVNTCGMSGGSRINDKVGNPNGAHRNGNAVSVEFKSAGGKSLSVSSAAEVRAQKIMEAAMKELLDDGSLLVGDASLADGGCGTGIGDEFKSAAKNNIFSSSLTDVPGSSTLAADNACNSTTFDTSCSAFQHTDSRRDLCSKSVRHENLPKGFQPFKTPRVSVKKHSEQSQNQQREPIGEKLLEKEGRDESGIRNKDGSDFSLIHKFPNETCSTLTNTQLAEVADVSWLLQHQADLLSTQCFGSATLDRQDKGEVGEDATGVISDKAKSKGASGLSKLGESSDARTSVKDCDDNMDMDCVAMDWDEITGSSDQFGNKQEVLDLEMMSVVHCHNTDEVKQLLSSVVNSAFDESMELCSTSGKCDAESKLKFPIGFQTAKGNPVKISSAALEKAKCILGDNSCDAIATESELNFPVGFQTAKGNPVKISSAALEKAKCILGDTSCDAIATESELNFPVGFQTAKGNTVKISSAALDKAKCILGDTSFDMQATESMSNFPVDFQTAQGNPVKISSAALKKAQTFLNDASFAAISTKSESIFQDIPVSAKALDDTKDLFSEAECDEKSVCDLVNKKAEDLVTGGDFLTTSKEGTCLKGGNVATVRRNEMHAAVYHDVNDWTESTDEDLLAAEVGPSTFVSKDLLSPALIVDPSFTKEEKSGDEGQLRKHLSHTHSGLLENSDIRYGCQQFPSYTTLPESFRCDRQGGVKSLDETPIKDKTPGASSRHFRLLTPLWTCPTSDVTSSSTRAFNEPSNPLSSGINSAVADSKQNAKFFTPYKKLPPQKLDKISGKAAAVAVLDASTHLDVQRNRRSGQQCSIAAKSDLTISKGEDGCPNVASTTEKLPLGDQISSSDVERTDEKCLDASEAGMFADADKNRVERTAVDDDGALRNGISGGRQKLVSVCEKVGELRNLAREEQLARVASKNHQSVRLCPGQLWLARKKGSGVTRIPMGSAVAGKRPASYSKKQLYSYGVLNQTMNITAKNAENFHFDISETFSTETAMSSVGCHGADGAYLVFTENGQLGKEEFCNALMDMPGVAPYLISCSWVYNHFRWIVWKLAAMEVAFPEEFAGRCLTPNNVMMQLKYRYDREVDHSQRSAIKKIFEKDDTSKKTMVLCVSAIFSANSLELTDGWYGIRAMLDGPLSCLVDRNRIRVGDKLCVFGSDLVGSNDATTPLEAPDGVALKICANSTRLAKWDTRLGFLHLSRPPKFPIVSVYPDGGMVGCLDVVLARIYPIQYLEKLPDGNSVMRSSSSEQKAVHEHEKRREKCIEKLSNRFQQKFEKEWESAGSSSKSKSTRHLKPSEIHSAVELYESYRQVSDPGAFESCLTTEQLGLLRKQIDQEQQLRQTELQEYMQSMMSEADDLIPARNVTPLLKIQIAGCSWQDLDAKCQAFFTIWRPSEEVVEMLKEGSRFLIFNVSAGVNRVRNCPCNVSFTSVKSTKYKKFPSVDKNFLDLVYEPRRPVNFEELRSRNFRAKYGEVDVAGIVVHVTSLSSDQQNNNKGGNQQTVHLVDDDEDFLAVKFWGGLALHDVQDSLTIGQVVSFTSLRSQVGCGSVPCAYYSDLSAFSVKYHQKHMRLATDTLTSCVKKVDFLSVMRERLMSLITPKSAEDELQKEDPRTHMTSSVTKSSSINKKIHFSGLRQMTSRSKQSSNQKPAIAYMIGDNVEEGSAKGNAMPPLQCKVSDDNCVERPLKCDVLSAIPTDEKLSSNMSGIETIDWCDDSVEDALLQATSLAITDMNTEDLTADSQSLKRTRKRIRTETAPVPQRKSSRLK